MSAINSPRELDISSAKIYQWLSDLKQPVTICSEADITTHLEAYMKAQGYPHIQRTFSREEKENLKKAVSALSFINAAHALRDSKEPLSSLDFMNTRILNVFNSHVAENKTLLIPDSRDLEIFSSEWEKCLKAKNAHADGIIEIQNILDPTGHPRIFPAALDLSKLGKDERLTKLNREEIQSLIAHDYPFLAKEIEFPFQETEGDILRGIGNSIKEKEIVKGAFLLKVAYEASLANPSTVKFRIEKAKEDVESIQRVFSIPSPEDLKNVLKNLERMPNDTNFQKSLLLVAWSLETVNAFSYLDPFSFSFMTDEQQAIWVKKEEIKEKAAQSLHSYTDQMIQKNCVLDHINFHEEMKPFITNRDEKDVTEQFKKDGHRYGKLVLTDPNGKSLLFPGENPTAGDTKAFLLHKLKAFAMIGQEFDPNLYATLQEAICQNLEKLGTEHRMSHELKKAFGDEKFAALVPIGPRKECHGLKKIDDTRFIVTHEYNIRVFTSYDPTNQTSHRVRIEYPIERDVSGSWAIRQPTWTYLGEDAKSLIEMTKPIPLPLLPEEVAKMSEELSLNK